MKHVAVGVSAWIRTRAHLASWWTNFIQETHSAGFELRRHFFARFFESELISSPDQAKVAAGGALGILISLGLIFSQAYYHKYLALNNLPDGEPYRLALMADVLFVIALGMVAMGLFTTIEWPALFPGLRDYLALAALPLRTRQIFIAKFTALLCVAAVVAVGATALPSAILRTVMAGDYATHLGRQFPAIFVSSSLAAIFVFLSLVTVQGVLLNLLPVSLFPRVSLALQGILLSAFLCGLPFVFSVPNLHSWMTLRPEWSVWVPPLWFLGLDQVMVGNSEPLARELARLSLAGVTCSAATAVLAYLWSYRRHRIRLLESPAPDAGKRSFQAGAWPDRLSPQPRSLAVFSFIAKSLARSRQHRLILTAFATGALAMISEGFAGLVLKGGFSHNSLSLQKPAFQQAVIATPLALSLFTLAGLRYLFRLPVELRANWVFRIHEPGHATELLAGVERFLLYCGVIPLALLALPVECWLLGTARGPAASALCLLASLALMEVLLFTFERIPFTSSYLPGQEPLIVPAMRYAIVAGLYVGGLSALVRATLESAAAAGAFTLLLGALWWRMRRARLGWRQIDRLEFEEVPEPAVQRLSIDRD